MIIVYSISTSAFEPISIGTNYLYSQYDKIQSFLLKNYGQKYKNLLAKPVLSGTEVNWYGNFKVQLSRLSDLSEEVQEKIKIAYWEAKRDISEDIQGLELAREAEKRSWALLLKEVFNDENNVIISDGDNWCLLWGWQFRNKHENYLHPSFLPAVNPSVDLAVNQHKPAESDNIDPVVAAATEAEANSTIDIPIQENVEDNIKNTETQDLLPPTKKIKPSFWYRIKRFLRRLIYRIWGLIFLIMLLLSLFCLFKYCSNKRVQTSCNEMNELNHRLIDVDKKVKDRCEQNNK